MKEPFFIVATPIGNRDDITTRAIQVLSECDFIVAEDTRHSGQLLAHYGIKKPLLSFRDGPSSMMDRVNKEVISRILAGGRGAYMTDAGTPGVSDPGWRLVSALVDSGIKVSPLPGPSAVTALVSVAHVPLEEYRFVGFLPKKKGLQTSVADLASYLQTPKRGVVLYESPKRVRKTLELFLNANPDLSVVVGRELTKLYETVDRAKLTQDFIQTLPEKGEYTILLYSTLTTLSV